MTSSVEITTLHILFFLIAAAPTAIYTLSLHDALPICGRPAPGGGRLAGARVGHAQPAAEGRVHRARRRVAGRGPVAARSEEHTSELQSHVNLVCRLLLEKKKPK